MNALPHLDRLGRLLSVAPDRLADLGALSVRDLDALTCQVSDALYAEDADLDGRRRARVVGDAGASPDPVAA